MRSSGKRLCLLALAVALSLGMVVCSALADDKDQDKDKKDKDKDATPPAAAKKGPAGYLGLGMGGNTGGLPSGMRASIYSNVPTTPQYGGADSGYISSIISPGLVPGLLTQPDNAPYGQGYNNYGGMPYGGFYPPYYPPFPPIFPDNSGYASFASDQSGFLRGTADVMNASGNLQIQAAQARLINTQNRFAKLEYRRRVFDQWMYERANMPTLNQYLEKSKRESLRRDLIGARTPEIVAGGPLNRIMADLREKASRDIKGRAEPIDESVLKHINLAVKDSGANFGLLKPLKDGGQLNWPTVLAGEAFQDDVKKINFAAAEAVKQVEVNGKAQPGNLNALTNAIALLDAKITKGVHSMSPEQYIEAKSFVQDLRSARRALENPNAAQLMPQSMPKGMTVPELIKYMSDKGLEIAPAVNGDEPAYVALYNYLTAYYNSIQASQN
jgi:hypothetical protein